MPIRPVADIAYKTGDKLGEYEAQRCKLDLYLPRGGKNLATLVCFHGGALKAGAEDGAETPKIACALARDGIAVASVNYRLSLKATYRAAGRGKLSVLSSQTQFVWPLCTER